MIWAVLQEGTVSGASRRLNVTQPAVSMMLRQARARIGFPLFERRGNIVVATNQLVEISPLLGSVFTKLTDLSMRIERMQADQPDMLRIATTTALSNAFVADALNNLQVRFPHIKASLESLSTDGVLGGVEVGRFDIGISISKSRLADVSSRVIGWTEIVCVVPDDDPLCRLKDVTADDLADRRIISYRPETVFGAKLHANFRELGQHFAPAIETNALNAVTLVAEGAGIGLIDGLVVRRRRDPRLRALTFKPKVRTQIYLLRPNTASRRSAALFERAVVAAFRSIKSDIQAAKSAA